MSESTNKLNKCIICNVEILCNKKTNTKPENFQKIIDAAILRKNERTYGRFEEATKYLSLLRINDLMKKKSQYHGMCYLKFTNTKKNDTKDLTKIVSNQLNETTSTEIQIKEAVSGEKSRFVAEERIRLYIIDNVVKQEQSLNMNDLSNQFLMYLSHEGISGNWTTEKKVLKCFIQNNIQDVLVLRPPEKNKPEVVVSKKIVEKIYFEADSSTTSLHRKEEYALRDASNILRKKFNEEEMWRFEGSFATYEPNKQIQSFFKNLISGEFNSEQTWKENIISRDANILVQMIQFMMKSKRQITHKGIEFRNSQETPMSVGLALSSHFNNRSRKLVDELHSLHIGISYTKLKQMEADIENSLAKVEDHTGGYVAPLWLRKNEFMCFAIDNIDFNEATCSGKDSLHGTAMCVIQKASQDIKKPFTFKRQKCSRSSARLPCNYIYCTDPEPKPEIFPLDMKSFDYEKTSESKDRTRIWMANYLDNELSGENHEKSKCLTWSTFNSFCTNRLNPITNIGLISPILRSPPTEYSALLTELMRAHNINISYNGEGSKTVVGLDMQLFDMAMRLWVADINIRQKFYFVAGPLHTVFWALQNIGTFIKDSGIEQAWIESGMYSLKTVHKILAGKQMKRALEAHTTTVLALCNIYVIPKIKAHKNKEEMFKLINEVKKASAELLQSKDEGHFKSSISNLEDKFKSMKLSDFFDCSDNVSAMEKFVFNYVKQFETILLYIKSIREADINLHLSSLKDLIKYFFAHNNLTYARLLPLQLHIFEKIKTESPDLWREFEDGNFVVTKNTVKFISIGLDHGLEQENKKLKIKGGIIGITQNMEALDRFFTIAPAVSAMVDEFNEIYVPTNNSTSVHHEFHGKKASRIQSNVVKLCNIFSEFGVGHEMIDEPLHNIFTKEIVPENIANDIVRRDELGEALFRNFVDERLIKGLKTVWDTIHESKIGTFSSNNATFESKDSAVGKIKEDRNLLQRFIVAARSRQDLDLKSVISKFEFGVVPRALFASDGSLLKPTDIPAFVQYLEKESKKSNTVDFIDCITRKKILIKNGLDILDNMKKDHAIINCKDLSNVFISILSTYATTFDEIHLIMVYSSNNVMVSNKSQRKNQFSQSKNRFLIDDNTVIKNTSVKDLLSNKETQKALIIYLSLKALNHSRRDSNSLKRFCVSYDTITEGNIDIETQLISHSHQSATTLSVLHGSTLAKNTIATFESSDPELLFLLTYFHEFLPTRTIMRYGTGKQKREIHVNLIKEYIGAKVESLLGFHAITGTLNTGKFFGKTKESTFKIFMNECTSESLSLLGEESEDINVIYEKIVNFICTIYKSPNNSIEETRWFWFAKEAPPEEMPPTKSPLMLHLLRAHYVTLIWKKALQSNPLIPLPSDFGWKFDEDAFQPIMNLDLPAPDTLLKLVKCKCKTGCKNGRCSCKKNGLPCTEMCLCISCENHSDLYSVQFEDEDFESEDET